MDRELTVLDAYIRRVYKIIMLIIPSSCLSASITVTTLHYLGYFADIDEKLMWAFNLMDVVFLAIGLFFIRTGFDSEGLVKKDKLFQGKYTAAMIAIVQWNAISYIWPFRDFWAYILLFLLGEAFFFDLKLVGFTSLGLILSTLVSWIVNGDVLLPVPDDYFVANMTFRLVCIFVTVMCINALTFFGSRFLVEELEKYVYRDPLTGLLTRKMMNRYLEEANERVRREKRSYCLLMMDIDDFKSINDTYGHECGDVVLKRVGEILFSFSGGENRAFRWGGEEFLLLLDGEKDLAIKRAESIRKIIQEQKIGYKNMTEVTVTVTVGVTSFENGIGFDALMEKVDMNLYEGKKNGKNQVVFH